MIGEKKYAFADCFVIFLLFIIILHTNLVHVLHSAQLHRKVENVNNDNNIRLCKHRTCQSAKTADRVYCSRATAHCHIDTK